MEQGHPTSVNRSERTAQHDPERTAVVPRFGETEIQQAQPAVPFGEISTGGARRGVGGRRPRALLVLAALAGLTGGVLGGVGTLLYQRNRNAEAERATQATSDAATPNANISSHTPAPAADAAAGNAATESARPGDVGAGGEKSSHQTASGAADESLPDDASPGAAADGDTQAALRGALDEWIAATNARDINRQMSFYDSKLNAFYLSRGTTREAVRAEKRRVFERASNVDVSASGASVRVSPDGRTATMRFRKRYAIEGGGQDKRGEVLQELRWRRTGDGWKIVSERDLRVID